MHHNFLIHSTVSATHRLLHVMATVNNVTVTPIGHFCQCSNVSRVKLTPMISLYWAFHLIWNLVSPLTYALCLCSQLLTHVWLFATPRTMAHEAPLSMRFPKQEHWSGLPFPSPGDLPDPGIEPASLASPSLAGRFLTTVTPGKPPYYTWS